MSLTHAVSVALGDGLGAGARRAVLRRAYDEKLIDPRTVGRSELDDVAASPRGDLLERMKHRYPPIDDVAEARQQAKRVSGGFRRL